MMTRRKRRWLVGLFLALVVALSGWLMLRPATIPKPAPARTLLPIWRGEAVGFMDLDGQVVLEPREGGHVQFLEPALPKGLNYMEVTNTFRFPEARLLLYRSESRRVWRRLDSWPFLSYEMESRQVIYDSRGRELLVAKADDGMTELSLVVHGQATGRQLRRQAFWREGLLCYAEGEGLATLPMAREQMEGLRSLGYGDGCVLAPDRVILRGTLLFEDEVGRSRGKLQAYCLADLDGKPLAYAGKMVPGRSGQVVLTQSRVDGHRREQVLDREGTVILGVTTGSNKVVDMGELVGMTWHHQGRRHVVIKHLANDEVYQWIEPVEHVDGGGPLAQAAMGIHESERWILVWQGQRLRFLSRDLALLSEVELSVPVSTVVDAAADGSWIRLVSLRPGKPPRALLVTREGRVLLQAHTWGARVDGVMHYMRTLDAGDGTGAQGLVTGKGRVLCSFESKHRNAIQFKEKGFWVPWGPDWPGGVVCGDGHVIAADEGWVPLTVQEDKYGGSPIVIWRKGRLHLRVDDGPVFALDDSMPKYPNGVWISGDTVLFSLMDFSEDGIKNVALIYDRGTRRWEEPVKRAYILGDGALLLLDNAGKGGYRTRDGSWLGRDYDYPAFRGPAAWGF